MCDKILWSITMSIFSLLCFYTALVIADTAFSGVLFVFCGLYSLRGIYCAWKVKY